VPTISVHPKNVSVYLVGNITEISFSCKATGIPKPVIGWLKNNSTKSNGTVIQTGSISVLILLLKEKEKAPGKYSCIATNSIGQAYSKEGTLEILTRRSLPIPVPIADQLSFYSHPRSITASPGENVVFTCVAEGTPVPKITWLKDGVADVNGKAKSFVGEESSTSVLMIDSVQDNHSGKYTCRAAAPIGSVTSNEAQLFIKGDVSTSNGVSKFLWILSGIAAVLLVVVVILILVIYNSYKKADFDIHKEINKEQRFLELHIYEDAMSQKLKHEQACTALRYQMTNTAVEKEE